jgi:fatty acid desaturase
VAWHAAALPWWVLLVLGAWLVGWHNSLQHETVHGLAAASRWISAALGMPALGLWMPYTVYHDRHLEHHRTPEITSPTHDPESFYFEVAHWQRLGPVLRALYRFNQTLLGRVLVGPALAAAASWRGEAGRLAAGERAAVCAWVGHAVSVAVVLVWVIAVCRIPLWAYFALFAYPGPSPTLVCSYLEHHPAAEAAHRTAIVEGGVLAGLLYLNNNLHFLHHARPDLPWFALPAVYRRERDSLAVQNGGYRFSSYAEVARRYFLRAKDSAVAGNPRSALYGGGAQP